MNLLQVKHNLKAQQPTFPATTVRALVDECERLTQRVAELNLLVEHHKEHHAEETTLRERVKVLEAALKQTTTQLHGVGIARITTNYHFGNDFRKCTNGWCMEAAAALEGAK